MPRLPIGGIALPATTAGASTMAVVPREVANHATGTNTETKTETKTKTTTENKTKAQSAFGSLLSQATNSALSDDGQPHRLEAASSPPERHDDSAEGEDPSSAVTELLMMLPSMLPLSGAMRSSNPVPPQDAQAVAALPNGTEPSDAQGLAPHLSSRDLPTLALPEPGGENSTRSCDAQGSAVEKKFSYEALHKSEIAPVTTSAMDNATITETFTAPVTAPFTDPSLTRADHGVPAQSRSASSPVRREFSEPIRWMTRNDLHSASLTLNPPELGPVRVELTLAGAEATARFASAVPEVRQAIESGMAELRAMLVESGLTLASASVNPEGPYPHARDKHEQQAGRPTLRSRAAEVSPDVSETATSPTSQRISHSRLLDLYA